MPPTPADGWIATEKTLPAAWIGAVTEPVVAFALVYFDYTVLISSLGGGAVFTLTALVLGIGIGYHLLLLNTWRPSAASTSGVRVVSWSRSGRG